MENIRDGFYLNKATHMTHTLILFTFVGCTLFCSLSNANAIPAVDVTAITQPIDSIVIIKSKRQMEVYHHHSLLKVFHVCLGPEPIGPKHVKNDGKTPEGIYCINGKNPNSHYHKSLGISYPSASDILYANSLGQSTGGDIKIHGLPNGKGYMEADLVKADWTLGCIALTDTEIDELYAHVTVGTCVNILP
jgi:murein L,D-transpeptidase YafK